ncbi:hypothetical protein PV325_000163, partial [Microctonus aethiopoides]
MKRNDDRGRTEVKLNSEPDDIDAVWWWWCWLPTNAAMLGRCQLAAWTWPLEPMLRRNNLVRTTTTTTTTATTTTTTTIIITRGWWWWWWIVTILAFVICGVHAGPRYASRNIETKSGQVRGILQ